MALNQWLSLRATRLQGLSLSFREPWQPIPKDLGLLIRYQTAADRAFHKAHAELLKLQKERRNQEIGFVSQNTEEAPPDTAETPQNTAPATSPAGTPPPEVTLNQEETASPTAGGGSPLPRAA